MNTLSNSSSRWLPQLGRALVFGILAMVGLSRGQGTKPNSNAEVDAKEHQQAAESRGARAIHAQRIVDPATAVVRAQEALGRVLPRDTTAVLVSDADESLVTDKPVSKNDPAWLVRVPMLQFELRPPKDAAPAVYSTALPYEVLIRESDGAMLRAQTPPITLCSGGTVRSLPAKAYLNRMGHECAARFHGIVVSPRSTAADAIAAMWRGTGGPDVAKQIIISPWRWSSICEEGVAPGVHSGEAMDTWRIETRSDSGARLCLTDRFRVLRADVNGHARSRAKVVRRTTAVQLIRQTEPNSVLGGFEEGRGCPDPVSVLVAVVLDGSNKWIVSGNFPKPSVVDEHGATKNPGDAQYLDRSPPPTPEGKK